MFMFIGDIHRHYFVQMLFLCNKANAHMVAQPNHITSNLLPNVTHFGWRFTIYTQHAYMHKDYGKIHLFYSLTQSILSGFRLFYTNIWCAPWLLYILTLRATFDAFNTEFHILNLPHKKQTRTKREQKRKKQDTTTKEKKNYTAHFYLAINI